MVSDRKQMEARIRDLEIKLEQLRFSRRVLMNLVERLEKEKLDNVARLERENKELYSTKIKFVRTLWHKNRQIRELETKLDKNI